MHNKVIAIPVPGGIANIDAEPSSSAPPVWRLGDCILGAENRSVLAAVEAILCGATAWAQPVVFYGPSGCGKSHLVLNLVQLWKKQQSRRSARYVTSVDFARELAEAIDTKTADEFRRRYRRLDTLAVDDVHLLQGRTAAQQELARTLDALADSQSVVVITASAAPERLDGLISHLQSRLVGGLAVPIAPPGPEARLAILQSLATTHELAFDQDVLEAIAAGVRGPVSALAAALVRLEAAARIDGQPITAETVRRVLKARGGRLRPTIGQIALAAARYFSLRLRDLRGPSRRQAVVMARDVAMYLARTLTQASLQQIGQYFAGRDHTTVAYACRKTERLLASDGFIRSAVDHLRDRLEQNPL